MGRNNIGALWLQLYLISTLLPPQNYEHSKESIFSYYAAVTNLSRLLHHGESICGRLPTKVEWRGHKSGRLCQENSSVTAMQGNVSFWGILQQPGMPMLYACKEDGNTSATYLQEIGALYTHSYSASTRTVYLFKMFTSLNKHLINTERYIALMSVICIYSRGWNEYLYL